MDALLGIDVGTTTTKAVLFDLKGHWSWLVLPHSPYYHYSPQPGWAEQDPEEIWQESVNGRSPTHGSKAESSRNYGTRPLPSSAKRLFIAC